ncbi:unnamed protein product [Eruca vesicaria subsp. sativa]|uniref:Uncharacterized protein n=1 Tax=Eruca vesicaria subsp. sativa TaxID=29727 RepID=A0ABC8K7G0_ERUVS|nr:unnamed protein product [Eruca vesicaria subsp. sativa]
MTTSGFEGVENRLEIVFKNSMGESLHSTLREDIWNVILQLVDCKIEDRLLSHSVNTYLLSASTNFTVAIGGLVESVISCFDPVNFTVAIVGSSKCSKVLKVRNKVVQWMDVKPVGAWDKL